MKRYVIALGMVLTFVSVADTAADAVMLRRKPEAKPAHSFLEDVVQVKKIEEPKPEAEAPKPAVETTKPSAEEPKPVAEPPKPAAEASAPVAETAKPDVTVEKKAEEGKPDKKANLFGMGGFMGDVLGLLANIFLFGAVFMLLRWAWNKFRGNSNSSYSGNSWQRPSEPVDVTPRENQRPVYQDISRIPSGDYDAKTTADRYRNR